MPSGFLPRLSIAVALAALLSSAGVSAASAEPSFQPPLRVEAEAFDSGAYVTWYPGDQEGLYSYVATASPGGASCSTDLLSTFSYGCGMTGLANGTAYTFTVVATRAGESSPPSEPSNSVVPRTDFSEPVLESSTLSTDVLPIGGGTVTVTAHITDEGSGLAEGHPQAVLRKRSDWSTSQESLQLSRTSGDPNDGWYEGTLTLPAQSRGGDWIVSFGLLTDVAGNSTRNEVFPSPAPWVSVGYPAAVTGVTAAALPDRAIRVSWDPVTDDGGVPVTRYSVYSDSYLGTLTTTGTSVDFPVPDSKPGLAFSFRVTAANATGYGPESEPSAPVTIVDGIPDSPSSWVLVSDSQLTVVVVAPEHIHGSPVTAYTVTGTPGDLTCTLGAPGSCTFPTVNGTAYSFAVTATNSVGTSAPTTPFGEAVPYGAPTAPTAVHAKPTEMASLRVTWKPGTGAGRPIDTYVVTLTPRSGPVLTFWAPGASRSWLITDARANTPYRVTVTSRSGALSSASRTAPERPSVPDVTKKPLKVKPPKVTGITKNAVTVRWKASSSPGGTPVTGYIVRIWKGKVLIRGDIARASARSLREGWLPAGKGYRVRVYAINEGGESRASSAVPFTLRK